MNGKERHQMLFALALEQAQKPAFAHALNLARLVKDEVKRLSNAQINGLAELANNSAQFETVDAILAELKKRNDARWGSDSGPLATMTEHIGQLQGAADKAVAQAEKTLAQATDASIARDARLSRHWDGELHLQLTRHYLDAAATLARTAKAAAPPAQQEE